MARFSASARPLAALYPSTLRQFSTTVCAQIAPPRAGEQPPAKGNASIKDIMDSFTKSFDTTKRSPLSSPFGSIGLMGRDPLPIIFSADFTAAARSNLLQPY